MGLEWVGDNPIGSATVFPVYAHSTLFGILVNVNSEILTCCAAPLDQNDRIYPLKE